MLLTAAENCIEIRFVYKNIIKYSFKILILVVKYTNVNNIFVIETNFLNIFFSSFIVIQFRINSIMLYGVKFQGFR